MTWINPFSCIGLFDIIEKEQLSNASDSIAPFTVYKGLNKRQKKLSFYTTRRNYRPASSMTFGSWNNVLHKPEGHLMEVGCQPLSYQEGW